MIPLFPKNFGNGQKQLIVFHGVGQHLTVFQELSNHSSEWKIWVFPLIFVEDESIILKNTPYLYVEYFKNWLSEQNIQKFSVLGYSLGAKPALAIFKSFSHQIEKIYLIAPEGIKENFWYQFATNTILGQFLMQKLIKKPSILQKCIRFAEKIALLPHSTAKIALSQTHSVEKLSNVWQSWMLYRKFQLDDSTLNLLQKDSQKCVIYLGKKDQLTQNKAIVNWCHQFSPPILVVWLEGHHTNLITLFIKNKGLAK
jgi:pimeloyl-ACP methyl ester carboxylesterase